MILFGWGGYIIAPGHGEYDEAQSIQYASELLAKLKEAGYNAIRYEAGPAFLNAPAVHRIKYPVLDHLVLEAGRLGMTVIIDPVHNYPPRETSPVMQEHWWDWLGRLREVGHRYNARNNVILECVNEYTLSDAPEKFQAIVDDLREKGITLPLHFNYWWDGIGHLNPPNDPLAKVSIGHHMFGDHDTDERLPEPGESWIDYCTRIGLEARMQHMFNDPADPTWFAYAQLRGTKVLCTEIGASNSYAYSAYNIAFCMRFLEYAREYDVDTIMFRVGDYGDYDVHDERAQTLFGRGFFKPTPTPRILATVGGIVIGGGIGYVLNRKKPIVPMIVGAVAGGTVGFIIDRTLRS